MVAGAKTTDLGAAAIRGVYGSAKLQQKYQNSNFFCLTAFLSLQDFFPPAPGRLCQRIKRERRYHQHIKQAELALKGNKQAAPARDALTVLPSAALVAKAAVSPN